MKYKGVIFDLDGVIVSTDECHYLAWKRLADSEGVYFDRNINQRLRGVSREDSLAIVLERSDKKYPPERLAQMSEYKNEQYLKLISRLSSADILPGAADFIGRLKAANILTAVGSSSRNAGSILKLIGMQDAFDAVVDGNSIKKSKPDPEVFLIAAEKLGLKNSECLVVEDAVAGVKAAIASGSDVLAVGFASGDERATYRASDLASADIGI